MAECAKWTLAVPAKYGSEEECKEGDLGEEDWLAGDGWAEDGLMVEGVD